MDKLRASELQELANSVMEDVIVEASEFLTVPGNTVEKYVDGLFDNFIDFSDLTSEEIDYLKQLLTEASLRNIQEGES